MAEPNQCALCGAQGVAFGATRCNTESCYMVTIGGLRAQLQALTDVRTLDQYDPRWRMGFQPYTGLGGHVCFVGQYLTHGETPEAARAKAAAWVREQSK